jgi:hypothetical protein
MTRLLIQKRERQREEGRISGGRKALPVRSGRWGRARRTRGPGPGPAASAARGGGRRGSLPFRGVAQLGGSRGSRRLA